MFCVAYKMKNTIIARLEMIFSQTDIDRITVKDTVPKNLQVMVDVHGMKCCEAKKFINNIINAVRTAFKLVIIVCIMGLKPSPSRRNL